MSVAAVATFATATTAICCQQTDRRAHKWPGKRKIVKFIFIFMAWLCFRHQPRLPRPVRTWLPLFSPSFTIFSELAAFQFRLKCLHFFAVFFDVFKNIFVPFVWPPAPSSASSLPHLIFSFVLYHFSSFFLHSTPFICKCMCEYCEVVCVLAHF